MKPTLAVGLYIHFPYCKSRCTYCDFNAYLEPEQDVQANYLSALLRDIQQTGDDRRYSVRSVFFGGGTPSLYDGESIARVMDVCRMAFAFEPKAEITLECNPGTVTYENLKAYRRSGVNRISIGVQTFDTALLTRLNRVHSPQDVYDAMAFSRKAGFQRVSMDLIYGLPGQTMESWKSTVDQALALKPDHFSIYQLTIEPGTHLEAQIRKGEIELPPEELTEAMDLEVRPQLRRAGFSRYEVSNWCQPDQESRHNLIYWRDQPYLGLGCGASGFIDGWRIRRILNPEIYARAVRQGRSPVASAERMGDEAALKDCLMMGLRTRMGVPFERLHKRFPTLCLSTLEKHFKELPPEWVQWRADRVRLTSKGVDFATSVQLELMDWKLLPATS